MNKIMNTEELLEHVLGHPIRKERRVPGTYLVEGREFRYVSNKSQVNFDKLFHELFNVPPKIPQKGGALVEGCKITLPNGDIFEAVSYKGDIEGWRQQFEQGAKALNEELAGIDIDTDSIVLNDTRSFPLTECMVEFY
ncbi:MAG: hypothetical protein NC331_10285 [Lachnospiraceae bacterium]|nr:hypothetical protein [Lachnospiraceae bacterium]MCM1239760.1 hypothetical protein [Lachnospiraceae bacterium]